MTVRVLGAGDLPALRALRRAALTGHPEAFGSSPEENEALDEDARLRQLAHPNAVFGAFAGDRLVGMAGFAPLAGIKRRHRAMLWGVYVASEHRGAGFARSLVQAVIAHASGRVLVLEAAVGLENAPARALYAGLGFREYGIERRALRIGDTFQDEALIVLDLPHPEKAG